MTPYKIEAGTAQHIGNREQQNDRTALFTGARAPGYVMAVLSDGVAGPAGADQVLHTAKQLFDEFKPAEQADAARVEQLLRDIIHEAHVIIQMNSVAAEAEMHASFVALVLTPHGEAVWAHVGDSRLYRFEGDRCLVRSSDATYIDHLVNDRLSPEAARNHRRSKLLLNLLGNNRKEPFVTVGSHTGLTAGDSFLLCSDGLWHFFTDAELAGAINRSTPRQASEMLIEKANERAQGKGGNCTMAIVKLTAGRSE